MNLACLMNEPTTWGSPMIYNIEIIGILVVIIIQYYITKT